MFAFVGWLIELLTAVLGWGGFLFLGVMGFALLLGQKQKILGCVCLGYAVAFLIVRFFFSEFYFRWMPGIVFFLGIISAIGSRYEDRVKGKRWWNW